MKKKLSFFVAFLMLMILLPTSAYAQEAEAPPPSPTPVYKGYVVIREDVSSAEAQQDPGFSATKNALSKRTSAARGAYWLVYGDEPVWVYDQATYQNKAKPVGYSAHKDSSGNTLQTYHYTRTYINYLGSKRGDSDKKWAYGLVKATGTYCIEEVWSLGIHTVKYGTEG